MPLLVQLLGSRRTTTLLSKCLLHWASGNQERLSVNTGDYLECHLLHVIDEIERRKLCEIVAIGIGHEVARYHKRTTKVGGRDELVDLLRFSLPNQFKAAPVSA
jgi:cobalamin biosynthesis protein CobT